MASSDGETVQRVRAAVSASLRRCRLLGSRRTLIVAVSGGADSLCLFDALASVVPSPRRRLRTVHIDHQLRPASEHDGAHVRQIVASRGLAFQTLIVNVPELATRERRGVEDAARVGRYRALRALAQEMPGAVVLTGHTASDSVETVLLHLLRGTGLDGLGGLRERESLPPRALGLDDDGSPPLTIIRPLLTVTRAATLAHCEERGLPYLTDETNADPRLLRNRVRSHLLPVLRTYNPSIDRTIARMATTAQDDDGWMTEQVAAMWKRFAAEADGAVSMNLRSWRRQPPAAQRRLVRLAAERLGASDLGFDAIARALAVGSASGPPRADLGDGLRVERTRDSLKFWRQGASAASPGRAPNDRA